MNGASLFRLTAFALVLTVTSARAEPCDERSHQPAMAALACEVARTLGASAPGALVVAAPLESDRPLREPGKLPLRLASLVAGRIGNSAQSDGRTATLATARGMASTRGLLLYLSPVIQDGRLRLTADLHRTQTGFWDRIRTPRPGPIAHAYAERPLDAEVASYLRVPDLVLEATHRLSFPHGTILALACGRTRPGRGLEVVALTRHRIHIGALRRAAFHAERDVAWNKLSEVAGAPLRQPLAFAIIASHGIDVGLSDRSHALRLHPDLSLDRVLAGQVPWTGDTCLQNTDGALGRPIACVPELRGELIQLSGRTDAFAAHRDFDAMGRPRRFTAFRDPRSRLLTLQRAGVDDASQQIPGVGAQVALGDLDLDGNVEILTTEDTLDRGEDALTVRTWADGTPTVRTRSPVPTGIDAIAICPHDRRPIARILVATAQAIWVFG
jgi:hypothetical protein